MVQAAAKKSDSLPFNAPAPDHAAYLARKPFAYQIVDNFLPADVAEAALAAFPDPDSFTWRDHGRNYKKDKVADKYEMTKYNAMAPALQRVVDVINGPEFVNWLCELTGFDDLQADMTLNGGGLNMVKPGGFLRTHADFNWSNDLQAYRTVNALLYLNKGWKKEWGGCLELWEQDMSRCVEVVEPEFNRLAVFTTFNTSFHGYKTVKTPDNRPRKSFNFYFYRKEAAPGIEKAPRPTIWRTDDDADL